ncbi:hypothetical protein MRB53_030740 [Persea americana]|uniref:Uncharacterized protein n=1 Tax=Persea americana TaxID=3435 RepID=A0ACC2KM18_PERAE|nr:hypothetical protein MRB53_030740 [Persea americana]
MAVPPLVPLSAMANRASNKVQILLASSSTAMQAAVASGELECDGGESFFPFSVLFFSSDTVDQNPNSLQQEF